MHILSIAFAKKLWSNFLQLLYESLGQSQQFLLGKQVAKRNSYMIKGLFSIWSVVTFVVRFFHVKRFSEVNKMLVGTNF